MALKYEATLPAFSAGLMHAWPPLCLRPYSIQISQLSKVSTCKSHLSPCHHDQQAGLTSNACYNAQGHACSLQDWPLLHVDFHIPVPNPVRLVKLCKCPCLSSGRDGRAYFKYRTESSMYIWHLIRQAEQFRSLPFDLFRLVGQTGQGGLSLCCQSKSFSD